MFFDRTGLLNLFQGEAHLNNPSSCSEAQILMHGFKGELTMNMFLNIWYLWDSTVTNSKFLPQIICFFPKIEIYKSFIKSTTGDWYK